SRSRCTAMASATSRRARYCSREKRACPSRSNSGMPRSPEERIIREQVTRPARRLGSQDPAVLCSFYAAAQEASLPLLPRYGLTRRRPARGTAAFNPRVPALNSPPPQGLVAIFHLSGTHADDRLMQAVVRYRHKQKICPVSAGDGALTGRQVALLEGEAASIRRIGNLHLTNRGGNSQYQYSFLGT